MKRKSIFAIILSFVMSFVLFGTAFSTFIFSDSDHVNEKRDDGEGFIDDINNNYTLDANSYTVYFFASPAWAHYVNDVERKEGQSLDDYLSYDSYLNYVNNTLKSKSIGPYSTTKYNVAGKGTSSSDFTPDTLKKIGYYPDVKTSDNMDIYGYKKRYADTCISSTTFDSLNNPTTTGRDQEQYRLLFIGWTANIKSAMDYGYNSQGNYDYVSAYDELALLDNAQNDCQKEADKVIFLYPVFTAGKEYASVANNRANGETVVRLHGRNTVALTDDDGKVLYAGNTPKIYFDNELYFSQNGSRNAACYSYKNLRVEKNQRLYLDFALSKEGGSWGGAWYNFWDSVETASGGIWEGELTKLDSYKNSLSSRAELRPLFDTVGEKGKTKEDHWCAWDQPGIYNIYVYPHCEGNSLSSESDYNKISSYGTLSDEFEKIQLSNTSLVWYEDPKDSTKQVSSWYTNLKYFKVYVKIEQVMELNLGGGRAKSLEQSHGAQLNRSVNIIPSDSKTDSSSGEVVKEGESSRYYVANNVFLEGTEINEMLTSFNSTNGKEYHYPSDVSVVLSTGNQAVPVVKASNATLTDFDAQYHKTYGNENLYNFLNTEVNRYNLATKDAMVGDDKEIGGVGLPLFTNSTASDGNTDYFVRTKDSGFYSVFAKIKLTSKRVDGAITKPGVGEEVHHYCTLSFDSCEIGLAYGKPIYSYIYLYQNGIEIKREGKKVENSGDFIEVDETKGNWYAKAQVLYGNPLTYSTEFRLRNSEDTITLGKILGVAATGAASHLTNHFTGREFRFDDSGNTIRLRRSYAFYIMPGAWKEGELKKTV